jgi:putative heme-binding domain-containing protein
LFSEWVDLRKSPETIAAVRKAMATERLRETALELADDLGDPVYGPDLLALARSAGAPTPVRAAAVQALGKTQKAEYLPAIEKFSQSGPLELRVAAIRAIGYERPPGLEAKFARLLLTQAPNEVRTEAVRIMGRSDAGLTLLLDLQQKGELPAELKNIATLVTNSSRNPVIQSRAAKLLPPFSSKNQTPLPPVWALLAREGNAERGRKVFDLRGGPKCSNCHTIGHGKKVGPDLGTIGSKLGKQAILDAILNPSAGIAPEFYLWILDTKTQGQVIGIIDQDTPQRVVVKTDTGEELRLKPSEIVSRRRSKLSMMPEDLVNSMTEQQLVDLLQYLTTLKEATRAAR